MAAAIDTINALVTLAELKEYLSNNSEDEFLEDTDNDDQLTRLINAASLFANKYTGVDLLKREQTEYRDGDGSQSLFLNNFPVLASPAVDVRLDSERVFGVDTQVPAAELIVDYDVGLIRLEDDCFPSGAQTVKVVYTAGHTTGSIPGDLAYAIFLICEKFWKNQKDKLAGVASLNMTGASVSFKEKDIPETALTILDHFSRAVI